jgi:hypothetical protein
MDTRQAKDFLVAQAAEQASIEGLPLADVEKRMMYFTESDPDSCPDPVTLNDEFETQRDSDEYEAKMFKLLNHAYARLRKEDPERARNWQAAVRELQKGDHYLLILLGLAGTSPALERPKHDILKLIGTALLVVAAMLAGSFFGEKLRHDATYWLRPLLIIFVLGYFLFSRAGRLLLAGLFARSKRR